MQNEASEGSVTYDSKEEKSLHLEVADLLG
jgi:hypothetical protein